MQIGDRVKITTGSNTGKQGTITSIIYPNIYGITLVNAKELAYSSKGFEVIPPLLNTLIVIGWLGIKKCYVNVSREDAIKRFCESEDYTPEDIIKNKLINEYIFDDEFQAYDAWN